MKNNNRENAINAIIEYFKENEDVFNDCMEQLDSYNGYLGDDTVVDVDYNGALLIDKPARFTDTTAVSAVDPKLRFTLVVQH